MEYERHGQWHYFIIWDLDRGEQGVRFYRDSFQHQERMVKFAGNKNVCLDWAGLPRTDFFEKYSTGNNAWKTLAKNKEYLDVKQRKLTQRQLKTIYVDKVGFGG